MAQKIPEFRDIFDGLLHRDKYVPWPVQISAAPAPNTALAAYNNHVRGHKNDTINKLQ